MYVFALPGILILRIYAMYDSNTLLMRILFALLGIQVATELVIIGPLLAHMKGTQAASLRVTCHKLLSVLNSDYIPTGIPVFRLFSSKR